jgi:hypothetical protein
MSKQDTIGVAFLGLGRMGETHLRNLTAISGVKVIDERFAQANDADTAFTLLKFKNGVLAVVETSRRSNWGYDIRTEVAGSVGKVVVEAPQKPLCSLLRISPQATIITKISPTVSKRVTDCSWRRSLRRCGKDAPRPLGRKTLWRRSAWPSRPPRAGAKSGRSKSQRSPHEPCVPKMDGTEPSMPKFDLIPLPIQLR